MTASHDYAEAFLQEARELLESLEQALLDLDQNPDNGDLIDQAFRALHTVKGSGSMFGFDAVAEFAHAFESAFDDVRKGKAKPSRDLIVVALRARDHLETLLEQPSEAKGGDEILADLQTVIQATTDGDAGSHLALLATASKTAPGAEQGGVYRVRFRLPEDALVSGANPFLLLDELRSLGTADIAATTETLPSLNEFDPEIAYVIWEVRLTTKNDRSAISDVFMFMADDMMLEIEEEQPLQVGASSKSHAAQGQPGSETSSSSPKDREAVGGKGAAQERPAQPDKGGSSMRVAAERLDELMNRVGELVIAQARLAQLASMSADPSLKLVSEELERLSSGLRDTTMGIRMVPIGSLFGRFRRLVHDLSVDLGKDISFVTTGEETELDKTVVEKLADPLVHIIRNSIDHGLERSADREATGKPAQGTVRLTAKHAGAEVVISIIDDGRGIDAQRVRAKAEEVGLLQPDSKPSDQELYQLIFHPGFSTAREVTSVSGRGVGMDVVKRTIESLRGTIDISTAQGTGTTITLRLPLTLAIIDGMLVRVGNSRYTIPLSSVEECVELPADAERRGSGRNFLNIRGSLVPYLSLRELFKAKTAPDVYQKVVIVSSGDQRVGLVVDQIIGNNQTVIKSLSRFHADVAGFSGATILGDGTVALILDVAQLVGFGQAYEDQLRNGRAA